MLKIILFSYLKYKLMINTPGTRVGPGFYKQTLAVKSRKNTQNSALIFFIFLLVMPKYEGPKISPEVGEKQ